MENLERLLSFLDDDREKAGKRYEGIRRRLINLFEWKGAMAPEALADEVMDRVARRLQSGGEFSGGEYAYFAGVAHHVYQEHVRGEMRQHAIASAVGDSLAGAEKQEPDSRLDALRLALRMLTDEERKLLLGYYQDNRIKHRSELAQRLGIPMNTLRIRVYRLRRMVEQRVAEILGSGGPEITEVDAVYKPQLTELPPAMASSEPDFYLIWDPEVLSSEEYSALVGALGDLVRASGGLGISRAQPEGYKVPASMVVPA